MAASVLYEELYCARGDMENRIKEQVMLFVDRTSTAYLWSNQLRLYFSSVAYVLLQMLRHLGLQGDGISQGPVRHDSPEAAEDRRPDSHQRAQGVGFLGGRISLCRAVSASPRKIVYGAAKMLKKNDPQ